MGSLSSPSRGVPRQVLGAHAAHGPVHRRRVHLRVQLVPAPGRARPAAGPRAVHCFGRRAGEDIAASLDKGEGSSDPAATPLWPRATINGEAADLQSTHIGKATDPVSWVPL